MWLQLDFPAKLHFYQASSSFIFIFFLSPSLSLPLFLFDFAFYFSKYMSEFRDCVYRKMRAIEKTLSTSEQAVASQRTKRVNWQSQTDRANERTIKIIPIHEQNKSKPKSFMEPELDQFWILKSYITYTSIFITILHNLHDTIRVSSTILTCSTGWRPLFLFLPI